MRKPVCALFWHQWEVQTIQYEFARVRMLIPDHFLLTAKPQDSHPSLIFSQATLEVSQALPRKLHDVSNKPFHTLWVCVTCKQNYE